MLFYLFFIIRICFFCFFAKFSTHSILFILYVFFFFCFDQTCRDSLASEKESSDLWVNSTWKSVFLITYIRWASYNQKIIIVELSINCNSFNNRTTSKLQSRNQWWTSFERKWEISELKWELRESDRNTIKRQK